jgi:hypothetical protein
MENEMPIVESAVRVLDENADREVARRRLQKEWALDWGQAELAFQLADEKRKARGALCFA